MRGSVALLQHVDTLVLTLERGWAGKGKYLAVLKHLGLTKSQKVVQVPNTFEYRATAKKVYFVDDMCVLLWVTWICSLQKLYKQRIKGESFADRASFENRDTRTAQNPDGCRGREANAKATASYKAPTTQ